MYPSSPSSRLLDWICTGPCLRSSITVCFSQWSPQPPLVPRPCRSLCIRYLPPPLLKTPPPVVRSFTPSPPIFWPYPAAPLLVLLRSLFLILGPGSPSDLVFTFDVQHSVLLHCLVSFPILSEFSSLPFYLIDEKDSPFARRFLPPCRKVVCRVYSF